MDALRIVMDWKLPSTGVDRSLQTVFENNICEGLRPGVDVVKFVVQDDDDYNVAMYGAGIAASRGITPVFSPMSSLDSVSTRNRAIALCDKLIQDRVPGVLSVQMHKLLGIQSTEEKPLVEEEDCDGE